ncbi:MAG: TatD family hydrolase, partial [Prevotella sp.]|nr:TatD family hydrolase [Prevotella sp.]
EAEELLQFDNFVLGIGGVLTFKKSNLPEVIKDIPLSRIVLETDAPYMAPTPKRGERNESAYVQYVLKKVAECYGVGEDEVAQQTNENVLRVFNI